MEYVYKHMDWSNVEVLGRNRLPVRPFYRGYPNKESARQGRREERGGRMKKQNGRLKKFEKEEERERERGKEKKKPLNRQAYTHLLKQTRQHKN